MTNTNSPIDLDTLPIKATFVGKTHQDAWECLEWRIEIQSKAGYWSFPYYCGLAYVIPSKQKRIEPKPRRPSNADILHSLLMDSSAEQENFHDWCDNYGYSDDSIKALNTYKECLEIGRALRKHFGRETVEQLREQLQDH